jgi:putative lipoic acid-binding regulatory protein
MSEPRFEDLVTFPCTFSLRVVLTDSPEGRLACERAAVGRKGVAATLKESRPSSGGRYIALHYDVWVEDAEDLREMYGRLGQVEGVKFVL